VPLEEARLGEVNLTFGYGETAPTAAIFNQNVVLS
jgi:hypothetical protein